MPDGSLQAQVTKKREERSIALPVPSATRSDMADCREIKLRAAGYRLVYRANDDMVYVTVIPIDLRDRHETDIREQRRVKDETPH